MATKFILITINQILETLYYLKHSCRYILFYLTIVIVYDEYKIKIMILQYL